MNRSMVHTGQDLKSVSLKNSAAVFSCDCRTEQLRRGLWGHLLCQDPSPRWRRQHAKPSLSPLALGPWKFLINVGFFSKNYFKNLDNVKIEVTMSLHPAFQQKMLFDFLRFHPPSSQMAYSAAPLLSQCPFLGRSSLSQHCWILLSCLQCPWALWVLTLTPAVVRNVAQLSRGKGPGLQWKTARPTHSPWVTCSSWAHGPGTLHNRANKHVVP